MIYRLFPLLKNPSSIFGIRLFIDGRWKTVITDAFFPVDKNNRLVYARSNNEDLWIMLIEKAMAKIYRSYEDIHLGWTEEGLNVLTGAPTEKVMVGGTEGAQNGGVVEVIRKAVNRKCVVCCSGKVLSQATMEKQSVMGLSTGRSYTVVNVYKDIQS
jgi:calpain-15